MLPCYAACSPEIIAATNVNDHAVDECLDTCPEATSDDCPDGELGECLDQCDDKYPEDWSGEWLACSDVCTDACFGPDVKQAKKVQGSCDDLFKCYTAAETLWQNAAKKNQECEAACPSPQASDCVGGDTDTCMTACEESSGLDFFSCEDDDTCYACKDVCYDACPDFSASRRKSGKMHGKKGKHTKGNRTKIFMV